MRLTRAILLPLLVLTTARAGHTPPHTEGNDLVPIVAGNDLVPIVASPLGEPEPAPTPSTWL
ncbi:hypothetical protein [Deinococcus soli (ex Cha et al. 2016)]|uniref:hypothetical protein n=1 Tax=Deinococcus soli (ex Cha et al. 2016) TaxID=1309411 RepID=UPI0016635E84|nr:hypothetical protein [Deinococcus soli (ex Cha et al. 2016)]GGB73953.1 hypothetical protein GCM10008019_32700 [Deinococcus soli (ex Cha et al. 2016)]